MKFLQKKGATWVVAMAMLAIPGTLITSCSKDNNSAIIDSKSDKLTISVGGIKNETSEGTVKRGSNTTINKTANSKIYSFSDVDMAVSIDNNVPIKTNNLASTNRANGLAADAAPGVTENMEQDVVYVVYIYSGNTLVASKELKSGTAGTIEGLDPAGSYTWVALSYNTKDGDKPALTPANGAIALPQNKDVLYASGTVDLATSSNINILFNHAFSRIGIELNTIGVFGEITGSPSVTVSGLNLATGSIDLLTGTVSAGDTFVPTLSYADFVNIDPAHNDAKIAYVYTASTAEQNAIKVTLQNLNINHVDGNVPRTYFANATEFGFQVTPELGKSHRLLLNVIESPLVTGTGTSAVRWSRSNLFDRNSTDPLRAYAFYATNAQRSRADGYFSYGSLVAARFPSTAAQKGDPCTRVYPEGLWKQPSEAQVSTLTTSSGLLTSVVSAIGQLLGASDPAPGSSVGTEGGNHAQYAITSGGTTGTNAFGGANSNSNNLRFFYNGQIVNTALLSQIGSSGQGLLGLGLSTLNADLLGFRILGTNVDILGDSYNASAAFWTDSPVLGGPLLSALGTRVGYYGYLAYTTQAKIIGIPLPTPPFVKASTTAEALNVELVGLDLLRTTFKNVRCVRAN
ncbi:fimbrillin family protein [Sphingobacterium thalpophilum]|uniref:fimbrillin family protein n=1 Tax=Sphingobacterium thalpophilum TaxID=259 RepID=UPI003DA324D2